YRGLRLHVCGRSGYTARSHTLQAVGIHNRCLGFGQSPRRAEQPRSDSPPRSLLLSIRGSFEYSRIRRLMRCSEHGLYVCLLHIDMSCCEHDDSFPEQDEIVWVGYTCDPEADDTDVGGDTAD